jgi:hypothetical protein
MSSGERLFEAFFWIAPYCSVQSLDSPRFDATKCLWHYPEDVSRVTKEFRDIPHFCFPDLTCTKIARPQTALDDYFNFTLQDQEGKRVYGICVRTFDQDLGQRYNVRRRAKHCLCIITRRPYFAFFKALLMQLHGIRYVCSSLQISQNSRVTSVRNANLIPDIPYALTLMRKDSCMHKTSASVGTSLRQPMA